MKIKHLCLVLFVFLSSCSSGWEIKKLSNGAITPVVTSHAKPLVAKAATPQISPPDEDLLFTIGVKDGCIKSYQDFAYNIHNWVQVNINQSIPPLPPWRKETTVPIIQNKGFARLEVHSEITRVWQNREEIWLSEVLHAEEPGKGNRTGFLVYQVETKTWKAVSSQIRSNDNVFVKNLFVARDGSVWGTTYWNSEHIDTKLDKVPVLGRFNDNTGHFEFAGGTLEIPIKRGLVDFNWPKILRDKQDVFWIFINNDGIYTFDSRINKTEKLADLSGFEILNATLSSDGSLCFERDRPETYLSETMFYRWSKDVLYQFLPNTKTIVSISPPSDSWPISSGILVDYMDRLWLGTTGYRDSEGEWHIIHPNPNEYFKHSGDVSWSSPTLIVESSDHRLWYRKYLDQGIQTQGSAWYDPQTGKGCVFTNLPVNVIEDENQQLWTTADGSLYRLPITEHR